MAHHTYSYGINTFSLGGGGYAFVDLFEFDQLTDRKTYGIAQNKRMKEVLYIALSPAF